MSNQTKYNSYRQTFPEFVYESYQYDVQPDGLHIVFTFRIGDSICFHPTSVVVARPFLHFDQPAELMDRLIFNIGMAELVSYWKCLCPPSVKVECGSLNESQRNFWKNVYYHGLGEFFYTNGIEASISDFMDIVAPNEYAPCSLSPSTTAANDYLVPIGGGKDSVVTLDLLRENAKGRVVPMIMNPRGATVGCIEAAGYTLDDVAVVKRSIDPKLLELNSEGCLNGHTPFSAMLAFYTILTAQLSGIGNIALSNEDSANEATVVGTSVNHQYSKSLAFENDFRHYVDQYVGKGLNYFSFLRPLSELQIAMLFSRTDRYYDIFRSCNVGSKQDIWCGHCAKCLFAYIILSPFIPPQRLNAIFGKAMLEDGELKPIFNQLVGISDTKPFECVGTIEEVRTALSLTARRWYSDQLPTLLKDYPLGEPTTPLDRLSPHHNLNNQEIALLTRYVQAQRV